MPSSILLRATGLTTSPNELTQQDGSLNDATNVVIRRDNIIEPRRGFKLYGTAFGTSTDTARQLLTYQKRIIKHYNSILSYDSDGAGTWLDFDGSYSEASPGQRIRGLESNGNFYFTSDTGIKKISATSANDFTTAPGYIVQAGGVKAIDIQTRLKVLAGIQTSFFTQDSTVGYRVAWGYNDANENLVLGTPSQYNQIYNPLSSLLIYDFNRVIGALDDIGSGVTPNTNASGTMIDNENYSASYILTANSPGTSIRNNLIALATQIDQDILYANDTGTNAQLKVYSGTATGNTNSNSSLTSISSTANLVIGMSVTGTGIPANTLITNISGSTITINTTASTTATGVTFTFGPGTSTSVCTISFSTGTASSLFQIGSNIFLAGFTITGTGTINGAQTVATVGSNYITFKPADITATGSISISGCSIVSNEYRSLRDTSGTLFNTVAIPNTPATNGQLTYLQSYLEAIITRLQIERSSVISSSLQTNIISILALTTSATVILDIGIPDTVTSSHFVQIYRSATATASSTQVLTTDVFSNDELQLVYEAFPTATDIANGFIEVEDNTLEFFRGANLYTNPNSGEGPTQANDVPPAALDINVYKNTAFFANTRTRHRLALNLLGVTNMVAEYNGGTTPVLTLTNSIKTNTYSFVTGVQQQVTIGCLADTSDSLNGTYFTISSVNNYNNYYVWYKTSGGVASDPAVSGMTGIEVFINTGDTNSAVATKTANTIARYIFDFSTSISTSNVIITNVGQGSANSPTAGTSGFSASVTTAGRGEKYTKEITQVTLPIGSSFNTSSTSNYFTLNTPFNHIQYYVWYQCSSSVDPAISGKTGIKVSILTGDTAAQVATKTSTAIAAISISFTASVLGTVVTITNVAFGPAQDITQSMPGGFSSSVTQQGALQILLSTNISPAEAVDETARSLVRIINRNTQDSSYAYYTTSVLGVPGQFTLEARVLDTNIIYALTNNATTGSSFSPNLSPTKVITAASQASPTVISSSAHGLVNGDLVLISNTNSFPCADGVYTVFGVTTNTFSIDLDVTTAGTRGALIKASQSQFSSNEVKSNRIYYAKNKQPEAVPILNFFDVGAVNRAILRIFPLRDSLFVFKEDGLYRISGESAPYTVALFDSSYILLAPDSLDVSNNVIYSWTTQGITPATEAGPGRPISRVIDIDILKLASSGYNPNFKSITWGVGYESDNSYTVYVAKNQSDMMGTIGYRYSNLTNSWSTVDKTATCGVINPNDDKMYLGAGDTNFTEEERKSFDRTDYADREVTTSLLSGNLISSSQMLLGRVANMNVGDVISQVQYLSIYEFNALLEKLDSDPALSTKTYFSTLKAVAGDDLQLKIYNPSLVTGLAVTLDADASIGSPDFETIVSSKSGSITSNSADSPTVITTTSPHGLSDNRIVTISGASGSIPSINGTYQVTVIDASTFSIPVNCTISGTGGTFITVGNDFRDVRACFAAICAELNLDTGTAFKNYTSLNTTTAQEAVITNVNLATRTLTLNLSLPWIVGPMTVYNAIHSTFTYAPNDMMASQGEMVIPQNVGDALMLKHLREATVIFNNQTFTSATISFATDLVPSFSDVTITGSGNGIFGFNPFGTGFFGGNGASVPFRTYIPRNYQRCRFIIIKFSHGIAREKYSILGTTVTGEVGQSTRAYR